MGTQRSLSEIAQEIAEEARKLDVENGEETQKIADEYMKQLGLNKMERRIVTAFLDEFLEDCDVEPSER